MSVETGQARANCCFTQDLLDCYIEWTSKAVAKCSGSVDQCVWGNECITGLWNKILWGENLINKEIYYISHFLSSDGCRSVLT